MNSDYLKYYNDFSELLDIDHLTFTIPHGKVISHGFFKGCENVECVIIDKDFDVSDDCSSHFTPIAHLKEFKVKGDSPYIAIDGVLFYDTRKGDNYKNFMDGFLLEVPKEKGLILVSYPHDKQQEEYTIPNGVIGIACSAFENAKLTSLKIPRSVLSIGCAAFYGMTNLKELYVPNKFVALDIDHYDETKVSFELYNIESNLELDSDVIALWNEVRQQDPRYDWEAYFKDKTVSTYSNFVDLPF